MRRLGRNLRHRQTQIAQSIGAILATADFRAPLRTSLALTRGTGAPTFTRATTGTVIDYEGVMRQVLASEARFTGARRVRNLIGTTSENFDNAYWSKTFSGGGSTPVVTADQEANPVSGVAFADKVVFAAPASGDISFLSSSTIATVTGNAYMGSFYVKAFAAGDIGKILLFRHAGAGTLMPITLTASYQRVSLKETAVELSSTFDIVLRPQFGSSTGTVSVYLAAAMFEDITGRADQTTPSEYVSVGALCMDGDDNYLSLPGTAGNYASTPDSVAASITGDIDIRVKAALTNWTPAAASALVDKFGNAGSRSWDFFINVTGVLVFWMSSDGTANTTYSSTVATGFTDGTTNWVRVTRVASTGVITFYTSNDGVTWAQLGTTVASTVGALIDNTTSVYIGSRGGSSDMCLGKIYQAQIYNGIAGTLAVDFNPDRDATTPTGSITSSTTGEVWTINGASSIIRNDTYHGTGVDGIKCFDTTLAGVPIPTATLKGYLQEPARTNLCTKSRQFDAWTTATGGGGSLPVVTANQIAAPDGELAADKVVFTAPASGDISMLSSPTCATVISTVYTGSLYVKAFAAGDVGKVLLTRHAAAGSFGTVTLTADWQRIEKVETAGVTSTTFDIGLRPQFGGSTGTVSCYLSDGQLEAGAYKTSVIPTTTAAVTRNADVLTYPSAGNILGTDGTCYAEVSFNGLNLASPGRMITVNSAAERNVMYHTGSNDFGMFDGTSILAQVGGVVGDSVTRKYTSAWGAATRKVTSNGATVTSGAFDGDFNVNELRIGSLYVAGYELNGNIADVCIWTRKLPDAILKRISK